LTTGELRFEPGTNGDASHNALFLSNFMEINPTPQPFSSLIKNACVRKKPSALQLSNVQRREGVGQ